MGPRGRHSLQYIQQLYDSGEDRSQLENLIRAFRGIQALPPDDPKSFFHLGGLHGLPYREPGETVSAQWEGYCWHRNVLFPTWHRIYVLFLEDALRSIPGCQGVTLPFWDELVHFESTSEPVIPSVLSSPTFDLDGHTDNPLYSYKLQKGVLNDDVKKQRWSKPAGYETVRYPLSSLVGTEADITATSEHNKRFPDPDRTRILNDNVTDWLRGTVKIPNDPENTPQPDTLSAYARFLRCLCAPNYTVFSNTESARHWNEDPERDSAKSRYVVPLESPHNAIHLALGGFYKEKVLNGSPIVGAFGDIAVDEMAGFDPIFFFHHCFIDYTFAEWQRLQNLTKRGDLTLIETRDYPGTILAKGQVPNFPPGTPLQMTTPLHPFKHPSGEYYTSEDATDLNELGIVYGTGSLDAIIRDCDDLVRSGKSPFDIINRQISDPMTLAGSNPKDSNPFFLTKRVHNISLNQYAGSFVVRLYALGDDGEEVEVGREPVLSPWDVAGCANCQNNLDVDLLVPMTAAALDLLAGPTRKKKDIRWLVKIQTHDEWYEFDIGAPGEDRSGKPAGWPKVDDL